MGNKNSFECQNCYQRYKIKKKKINDKTYLKKIQYNNLKECQTCYYLSKKDKKILNLSRKEQIHSHAVKYEEKLREKKINKQSADPRINNSFTFGTCVGIPFYSF